MLKEYMLEETIEKKRSFNKKILLVTVIVLILA